MLCCWHVDLEVVTPLCTSKGDNLDESQVCFYTGHLYAGCTYFLGREAFSFSCFFFPPWVSDNQLSHLFIRNNNLSVLLRLHPCKFNIRKSEGVICSQLRIGLKKEEEGGKKRWIYPFCREREGGKKKKTWLCGESFQSLLHPCVCMQDQVIQAIKHQSHTLQPVRRRLVYLNKTRLL